MAKGTKAKAGSSAAPARISDPRFASFETDPRFRLPSKKKNKTTIDKRFSRMLDDDEFTAEARVDRYGRKIKSDAKKKALKNLYQEEDEEDKVDAEPEEEDVEVDGDEIVQRELRAAHEKYDPARGGGFSSSEEDDDSDSTESDEDDSDEEDGGVELETAANMQQFQDEQADVEGGEVTKRLAIVNLDWDHIKSTDLFALFSSFATDGGRVERVSVYPSEFGKERMQQEEVEGPPKELFKSKAKDSDSDSDSEEESDEKIRKQLMQEGNDEDFDSDALRKYQLDRLRYYYAVMECSDLVTAKKIYDATDGTEFQSSSNFLDLRFVPDDVEFDDEPRDRCDKLPSSYKPIDFVTNALQSSKVKLTWDMHPEEASRKDAMARAFSGSRAELEENDMKAYLASDTEDDLLEEEEDAAAGQEEAGAGEEGAPKLSKKELARKKMREALGLSDEPSKGSKKDVPVGDMEITFTPALSENAKAKKDDKEETTIEKYARKERERKEKKRQRAKAKREGADPDAAEEEDEVLEAAEPAAGQDEEDLGFNDPFFTAEEPAPQSKSAKRKEERLAKREARLAAEAASAADKAKLEKVMAEDAADNEQAAHLDHFDMNDIVKAEKHGSKKGKASKKKAQDVKAQGKLQEEFQMDVDDARFKAVFDSHEFAIDPSNPKFKATGGMKRLLEEGRKKRSGGADDDDIGDGEQRRKKAKKSGR
ncbi:uncharacterized protein F5Z01DRAFT_660136 [Emericellopsis atlantica]|uniref:NUC153 domain-containing protein n=1 Tax=Emericellopsis atlantica TaxID=2614577 RepID=A0A9P7ZIA4_9HYPO|nr:uncharacterized protein F5Z01DRAFT_660136 [Emericellopsis atlantica]KAG9252638.1 hypothetical protein F5Z01DRAFT_660136 [Emericellopsis atlantica]